MLNDFSINDISVSKLRNKIGYVPQNIELFTGTILENIRCGDETATYEQVIAASKLAGCYDFIQKLPNRFYYFIEEKGCNFSGGEKQRIAIARAFLKEKDIYIFDESTSNLDSFSEQYIQKAMMKATGIATVIIIAHRLSTIVKCDKIFFIANGKIIEQGTHEELIKLNGEYAKFINLQYGKVGLKNVSKKNEKMVKQEVIEYL